MRSQAGEEAKLANAMWGQCSPVADNHRSTDTIVLDRTPPYALRSFTVAEKPQERIPAPEGSPAWKDTPAALRDVPSITPEQLQHLAQAAMSIERYYKRPQEIEWACDSKGTLLILQTRPLRNWEVPFLPASRPGDATRDAEIVFSRKGFVAQSGVAVGKVFLVENDADLRDFPFGAILLSRYTSPRYSSIMGKACGVITDIGSPTGNMATIAREYRVPTIVDTEVATSLLQTGEEITLDATRNIVYRGPVNALGHFEPIENEVFEDSDEYRLLRRILKHIISFNIIDSPE